MVIRDEIISKHIVKPSSSTPNRCRNLKLSFLDQIQPPIYIPLIFFYQNGESKQHVEISELLKQSLSHILTVFYPLAGTIQENSFIDCNDTGVEFVEARVHARLAQVMAEPKMEELKQLVPVDSLSHNENAILLVKISFFDCGGIALGVCLSHKIADIASLMPFMNAWAATCRGETHQVIQPSFDLAVHFPPKDTCSFCYTPHKGKITTKRLVFDREKLERLRQQAASGEVKNPTRVEALSAFIWRNFIEASKAKSSTKKTSFAAVHLVNLRPRTIPPIPDHTFGNAILGTYAFLSETEDSSDLASKLRVAIRAVDDNYIKKEINDEKYSRSEKEESDASNLQVELCCFTSWWRFPTYDVDFGWGTPVWVCPTTMPIENLVILISNPSRDGIEAWINMREDFVPMLETNYNQLLN